MQSGSWNEGEWNQQCICGRWEMPTQFFMFNLRREDHLEDIDVGILLKRIVERPRGRAWTGYIWLRAATGSSHLRKQQRSFRVSQGFARGPERTTADSAPRLAYGQKLISPFLHLDSVSTVSIFKYFSRKNEWPAFLSTNKIFELHFSSCTSFTSQVTNIIELQDLSNCLLALR